MNWMGIHEPWAFVAAVLVFLALPGPGTFALLGATGMAGPRGGTGCDACTVPLASVTSTLLKPG